MQARSLSLKSLIAVLACVHVTFGVPDFVPQFRAPDSTQLNLTQVAVELS